MLHNNWVVFHFVCLARVAFFSQLAFKFIHFRSISGQEIEFLFWEQFLICKHAA